MKLTSIALDLDGTTLLEDGTLSKRTKDAIEKAVEKGICVVPASGRALASMPKELLDIPGIRYVITSNGTAVVDLLDGKYLRKFTLSEDAAEQILTLTKDEPVVYEAFLDGEAYAHRAYVEDPVQFGAMPAAISYIQRTRKPVEDMPAFIRANAGKVDCLDLVVKEEEKKRNLWKYLEDHVDGIYVTSSVPQLLEISHKEAGKETALGFLLDYLGLKKEEAASFGDGENDKGMLAFAGIGIAVANASAGCLAAADHITLSNDEEGVAAGIEWLLSRSLSEEGGSL